MGVKLKSASRLLHGGDVSPVEIVDGASQSPLVLVCEHAGRAIPAALGDLGVSPDDLQRHIAYDIGAEGLARKMAERLGAPLVLQRYSRLVIDCNRPVGSPGSVPEMSDGTVVPANLDLSAAERAARAREIFVPFHDAVTRLIAERKPRAVFAIHSFTPVMQGVVRPWALGFLFRHDKATSAALAQTIGKAHPGLTIGLNEPYTIDDENDWFVPEHGERTGIPHSLIEVRNDLIADDAGMARISDILADAIEIFLRGDSIR